MSELTAENDRDVDWFGKEIQEQNIVAASGHRTQRGLVAPRTGDQQLCSSIPAKNGNERLQAFELFEAAHKKKIRTIR